MDNDGRWQTAGVGLQNRCALDVIPEGETEWLQPPALAVELAQDEGRQQPVLDTLDLP
jgi:hypothetical protein